MTPPKKDTFAEHRKATAHEHQPINQIAFGDAAYKKGYAQIDWRKSTLDTLKKASDRTRKKKVRKPLKRKGN